MAKILKICALGFVSLGLSACNLPKSDDVVQAMVGKSLDQAISKWGYPSHERTIAGRTLLVWEEIEISYDGVPQVEVALPVGNNGSVSANIPLGEPQELVCRRVLEVSSSQTIVRSSLEGGNCPIFAPNTW